MAPRSLSVLKYALLVAPLALVPIISCNTGGGGGGGGNALTAALQQCGLLTAGKFPDAATNTDPYIQCINDCVAGLTCMELEDLVCGNGFAVIEQCDAMCVAAHGHGCDGETFPPYIKCDGFEDCSDGSDEVGCPAPITCDGGIEYPADYKCDGYIDCDDGTDEVGCPGFTCQDGTTIPQSWECDQEEDCADGSDELGCAMIMCEGQGETFGEPPGTTGFGTDTGGFDTGDTTG